MAFHFSMDLSDKQRDELFDRFIDEAIESNGLQFGGGGDNSAWDGFVMIDKPGGSAEETHRQNVEKWFNKEDFIFEYYVGPLVDGWYGDFDEKDVTEWKQKT